MTKPAHRMASDFLVRFWAKVEVAPSGCWLWLGAKDESGYGRFALRVDGRSYSYPAQATNIAWELTKGTKLPSGSQLNHTCDVAACVNPDHLYIGTQQENMRDRWSRTGLRKGLIPNVLQSSSDNK